MRAVDLNTRHVYLSPLGRRCKLLPGKEDTASRELFSFVYLDFPGGFSFTCNNVSFLKRES